MKILTGKWPFYISGLLLPLLAVLGLYLFDDVLGMSDAAVAFSGYCSEAIEEKAIGSLPGLDWQNGILIGLLIGALAGSLCSGNWKFQFFFDDQKGFGAKFVKTILYSFIGGFLVMLGSQLAGETLFGQYAAAIQLSAGAWIYLVVFFVVALILSLLFEQHSSSAEK